MSEFVTRLVLFVVLVAPAWASTTGAATVRLPSPADDDAARAALEQFREAYKAKDLESRQSAVFDLRDVPHKKVLAQLAKLLKDRDPSIRAVTALAIGGQVHDKAGAGRVLMAAYPRNKAHVGVLTSILDAVVELGYEGYWPTLKKALKEKRRPVVVRVLTMLGKFQDHRALDTLVKMFHEQFEPLRDQVSKGSSGVTGGGAGLGGDGGRPANANKSKYKADGDKLNLLEPLKKCIKQITGQEFDDPFACEQWYLGEFVRIRRHLAERAGTDPDKAEKQARVELPKRKKSFEKRRKAFEAGGVAD